MKILSIHNKYKFRGGEDEVREAEEALLVSRGHDVHSVVFDNAGVGKFDAMLHGLSSAWSHSSYRRIENEINSSRPDIVSIHNFFPLATPSIHHAVANAGLPIVQTLHNFRLICPSAILFREGKVCEDCLGKVVPWPGVVNKCYRASYSASASSAAMISVHNLMQTWKRRVTTFFALSEHAKRKFVQGGFPTDRIVVKPNFVPTDSGPGLGDGDYILYAGRLTREKGIVPLLDAWEVAKPSGNLLIVGDGPLESLVRERAERCSSILYGGRVSLNETLAYMGKARAFVYPSMWYEGMPRAIIEAFSRGTPVIANKLGTMAEMIDNTRTGWLVNGNDPVALSSALLSTFNSEVNLKSMRSAARTEFENSYTADRQYDLLMEAYTRAIEATRKQSDLDRQFRVL